MPPRHMRRRCATRPGPQAVGRRADAWWGAEVRIELFRNNQAGCACFEVARLSRADSI